jgi:hypothetical protein
MPNTRLPTSIFFMLVVLGAVRSTYYAPRIPEILGSHFARRGFVNGWQTKAAFFSTEWQSSYWQRSFRSVLRVSSRGCRFR